jgi:hypothetical protein
MLRERPDGLSADWRSGWREHRADQPGRLAVLVHEVRSPVAALRAIAEAAGHDDFEPSAVLDAIPLAVAACRGIERIVTDVAVASVRLEEVDAEALVLGVVAAASLSGPVRAGSAAPAARRRPAPDPTGADNLVATRPPRVSRRRGPRLGRAGARVLLAVAKGRGSPRDQSRIFETGCGSTRRRSGSRARDRGRSPNARRDADRPVRLARLDIHDRASRCPRRPP